MHKIKISIFAVLLFFFVEVLCAQQNNFTQKQYEEDFDYLWQSISDDYAYFDRKQTDWNKVREIYRPQINAVKGMSGFVKLLESVLEELYDFHTHLNTNTPNSPRLVPSGADIWAEWINGKAVITEVRANSHAEKAGLKAGMQIFSINGKEVGAAVKSRIGKSLRSVDTAARNWALRTLLAGRHKEERNFEVISNGKHSVFSIGSPQSGESSETKTLLDYRLIEKDIGYIRINNSLGNTDLIKEFDLCFFS